MDILAKPAGLEERNGPEIWVDESIWGHRLHDEQSPWLTVLEFMGVLHAEHRRGRALVETHLNSLSYEPQTQLRLRNLVFNNPHIATVQAETNTDEAAWQLWLQRMEAGSGGLPDGGNFGYLRDRFENFQDFANVVRFLQTSAIQGGGNKRWSSRFVFPFGPSALYEDLKVSGNSDSVSTDRRFFARTGELLYLMLCRSARRDELRQRLTETFLKARLPYDDLVRALQGEPQYAKQDRAGAYLPVASHPVFDRMAEDWLAILNQPIPIYDAIPHLVAVTGLNLVLYQQARSAEVLGSGEVRLICEIVSPKKSVVRDLSAESFQANNARPQLALEAFIRGVETTAAWETAVSSAEPLLEAGDVLYRAFDWPDAEDLEELSGSPRAMLEELVRKAIVRHAQHVGKVHATWSRLIGLSSRRSSRRMRYAPTDRLLKTLVVACVPQRLEFKAFLALVHDRYGFVIGDQQARDLIEGGAADQEDFSDNARRLEERLASLGLLLRLSDSFAYVENPFQKAMAA
jgi:hypothetical protein